MAAVGRMVSQVRNIVVVLMTVSAAVLGVDNFIVAHSPNYLRFVPTVKQLALSQVPDLLTSTYGFSPSHEVTWNGLAQGNLFRRPKANVVFSFDGFKDAHSLTNMKHVAKYATHSDAHFVNTESVSHRLQSAVESPLIIDFSAANSVFDVKAHYPELFSRLPGTPDDVLDIFQKGDSALLKYDLGSLNVSKPSDLVLLAELELIQEMIDALKDDSSVVRDNQPDLFHFRLGGFQMLSESYPAGSPAVQDALALLTNFLNQATEDFKTLYNGDVVVEVITMSGNVQKLVRKGRSLMQTDDSETSIASQYNLAADYSDDYPVAFNIILWTMIVLGITVLGVSIGLWNMDPGRDSIIYRMTSQRMKKD